MSDKYPKIVTVYTRDADNKYKTLVEGDFALPEFEYLADCEWVWTEKVDGTNIRVIWDGERVTFAGRTDNSQMPTFLLAKLQELFPAEQFINGIPMTLYGEGYGAKIQKGGGNYIPGGVSFILFDVKIVNWQPRKAIEEMAAKWGIDIVPVVGRGTLAEAVDMVRQGFMSTKISASEHLAEGLVMRPAVELAGRGGKRIITKIKYKDFGRENV